MEQQTLVDRQRLRGGGGGAIQQELEGRKHVGVGNQRRARTRPAVSGPSLLLLSAQLEVEQDQRGTLGADTEGAMRTFDSRRAQLVTSLL